MAYGNSLSLLGVSARVTLVAVLCVSLVACLQEPQPDYTLPRDGSVHGDGGAPRAPEAGVPVDAGLDARAAAASAP